MDQKIKYEKPVSVPLGSVAPVTGATDCIGGSKPSGGCVGGNDPQLAPVCQPGQTASYNCGTGTTNSLGNCRTVGLSASGCSTGGSPGLLRAQ
jgi:hypothetical protein